MIKNLLNADEDPPPGTKVIIEETVIDPPPVQNNEPAAVEPSATAAEKRPSFEIPEDAKFFTKTSEPIEENSANAAEPPATAAAALDEDAESLSALMADIENLDDRELDLLEKRLESSAAQEAPVAEPETAKPADVATENTPSAPPVEAEKKVENAPDVFGSGTLFQTEEEPRQSMAETIRQSGLAYSAAIVLFGSVIFMMILGWFADLLLGSSPWGIVGGIFLGGIIGFIQFFRITSQIFKK